MYLFFVMMKTIRFRWILNLSLPLRRFFPIIALHTFWTNILPMRTGDVSYIYLLKSREQVSGTKSVASLMVVSVLDILLQLLLIVGIAWYFKHRLASKISYTFFLLIPSLGILALLSVISTSLLFPKRCAIIIERIVLVFQRFISTLSNHFPLKKGGQGDCPSLSSPSIRGERGGADGISWIANKLTQLVNELTDVSFNTRLLVIFIYSIVILGMRLGMQCYLVKVMGLDLAIWEIIFALSFTAFCNMFPIQSVASIGTIELPWTWALVSLGASSDAAITSGFSLHTIIILYSALLGFYGVISSRLNRNRVLPQNSVS